MMFEHTTEVFDNDAGLYVFLMDDAGTVVWASHYYSEDAARLAAMDFLGIEESCHNPVKDGWEVEGFDLMGEEPIDVARDVYASLFEGTIPDAASYWYRGRTSDYLLHDDPDGYNTNFGADFARAMLG